MGVVHWVVREVVRRVVRVVDVSGYCAECGSVLSTFPSYRRRILQCRSKYCTSSVVILTSLTNSSNLNTNSTCELAIVWAMGEG